MRENWKPEMSGRSKNNKVQIQENICQPKTLSELNQQISLTNTLPPSPMNERGDNMVDKAGYESSVTKLQEEQQKTPKLMSELDQE